MPDVDRNKLAASVVDRHTDFEMALGASHRKYPTQEFQQFAQAARNYIMATRADSLIDRKVAAALNGMREDLQTERKTVPGRVLAEVERLECLLFDGYDPYFEGDEPPGL
ncbi:MAG: hypothetical protein K2X35_22975 [Bryobacteraceae bacterium]|nr:hypothetical protein [Bryobacteraceae bacterium]